MRAVVVSILLTTLLPLGGCFHHSRAVVETPLPNVA
jgi:hypothetical protein